MQVKTVLPARSNVIESPTAPCLFKERKPLRQLQKSIVN
jgi:hypothetical protein